MRVERYIYVGANTRTLTTKHTIRRALNVSKSKAFLLWVTELRNLAIRTYAPHMLATPPGNGYTVTRRPRILDFKRNCASTCCNTLIKINEHRLAGHLMISARKLRTSLSESRQVNVRTSQRLSKLSTIQMLRAAHTTTSRETYMATSSIAQHRRGALFRC